MAGDMRARGIKFIFTQPPLRKELIDDSIHESLEFHWQRVKAITDKHNASFINMGVDSGFTDKDFVDAGHLNEKGSLKFTDSILSSIEF